MLISRLVSKNNFHIKFNIAFLMKLESVSDISSWPGGMCGAIESAVRLSHRACQIKLLGMFCMLLPEGVCECRSLSVV